MRSRFRSTTDEDPSVEETPPPNMSERPPPLPLCRSTSRTITSETMIRMTESAISTGSSLLGTLVNYLIVPADQSDLAGPQPSPADERAVDVLSRHDRRYVV